MDTKDRKIKPGTDVVAVISEPGALVFATRKEWCKLTESALDELNHYDIKKAFMAPAGIFLLLRDYQPLNFPDSFSKDYLLVKINTDEEGKQAVHCMQLSTAEGNQLILNRMDLWD